MKAFICMIIFLIITSIYMINDMQSSGEKFLEKNGILSISEEERQEIINDITDNVIDSIIEDGYNMEGTVYIWGGDNPKGFDCSGFIVWLLKSNNIKVKRITTKQFAHWNKAISPNRGDLPLFSHSGNTISHIGIHTTFNEDIINWKMLHASSSKGIIETRFGPYWSPRYKFSVKIPIGRISEI
jgi:cell wall-associated NlpC family hydrolase